MPRFRVFSTLVLLRAMKADSRSVDWWLCVTCARAAPVHQRVVTLQLLNSGGLWRCVAAHLQVADMQLDSIRVLRLRVQNPALFSAASAHLSLPPSHPYSFLPSVRWSALPRPGQYISHPKCAFRIKHLEAGSLAQQPGNLSTRRWWRPSPSSAEPPGEQRCFQGRFSSSAETQESLLSANRRSRKDEEKNVSYSCCVCVHAHVPAPVCKTTFHPFLQRQTRAQ